VRRKKTPKGGDQKMYLSDVMLLRADPFGFVAAAAQGGGGDSTVGEFPVSIRAVLMDRGGKKKKEQLR